MNGAGLDLQSHVNLVIPLKLREVKQATCQSWIMTACLPMAFQDTKCVTITVRSSRDLVKLMERIAGTKILERLWKTLFLHKMIGLHITSSKTRWHFSLVTRCSFTHYSLHFYSLLVAFYLLLVPFYSLP